MEESTLKYFFFKMHAITSRPFDVKLRVRKWLKLFCTGVNDAHFVRCNHTYKKRGHRTCFSKGVGEIMRMESRITPHFSTLCWNVPFLNTISLLTVLKLDNHNVIISDSNNINLNSLNLFFWKEAFHFIFNSRLPSAAWKNRSRILKAEI